MIPYHRIASKVFNRPLMVTPDVAHVISDFLLTRIDARRGDSASMEVPGEGLQVFAPSEGPGNSSIIHTPRASRFVGEYPIGADGYPMPYRRTDDGKAIVTMVGELVNRGAWIGASSGLISYEGFKHQMTTAATDPKTSVVVLDVEGPGGEALGCTEASRIVREVAAIKPVIACVNAFAASAMYSVISGATRVYTIRDAELGSIGVVMLHIEFSEMLKRAGVVPTFVFCGARKVDGNPYEKLPDAVRDKWQVELERYYAMFVDTVALGRGLEPDAIRATEAAMFVGDDAVRLGLADEIGSFEDVIAMRTQELQLTTKGAVMVKTKEKKTSAPAAVAPKAEDETAETTVAAACETCTADGCSCAEKCTSKGCGCCDACGEMAESDEDDSGESSGAAGAATTAPAKAATEPTRIDRLRAIRDRAARANDAETVKEMDDTITALVSSDVALLMTEAKRGAKMNATVAKHLGSTLTRAIVGGDKETEQEIRASIAAMGPEAPTARLPKMKQMKETANTTAGDGVDDHEEVVGRLRSQGMTPGSAKWKAAYPKELSKLRAERAQ